jgi:hypothetical protein
MCNMPDIIVQKVILRSTQKISKIGDSPRAPVQPDENSSAKTARLRQSLIPPVF